MFCFLIYYKPQPWKGPESEFRLRCVDMIHRKGTMIVSLFEVHRSRDVP